MLASHACLHNRQLAQWHWVISCEKGDVISLLLHKNLSKLCKILLMVTLTVGWKLLKLVIFLEEAKVHLGSVLLLGGHSGLFLKRG